MVDPNKRGHDLPLAADTLVQFDSNAPCEILYDRVPITEVDYRKVQLIPRGGTPLLDAIGKATTHLMER